MKQASIGIVVIVCSFLLLCSCTNFRALNEQIESVSYQQGRLQYALDREETSVRFRVGDTKGRFTVADARLIFQELVVETGALEVTVASGSMKLFNPLVEQMLKGKDWFAVKDYPLVKFSTQSIRQLEGGELLVNGNLTVKDVSQALSLSVSFLDGRPNLSDAPDAIRFSAEGSFSRSSFGMDDLQSFAPDQVELEVVGAFVKI